MKKFKFITALAVCGLALQVASAPVYADYAKENAYQPKTHYLAANSDNVRWGNLGIGEPALSVNSGDIVTVEAITHHSGDDYERMIKGDAGVEDIFHWTADEKHEADRAPGVHILTGPIEVKGAEPGDVLEVRILDMNLRPSGNPEFEGKTYGSNAAANWGFLYGDMIEEPKTREVITIYEMESDGSTDWAKAAFSYTWTPQTDPNGVVHETIDYPGVIVDPDTIVKKHDILKDIRVPVRLHFGTMGVAPREADVVDSIPPSYYGGNIDDWRVGKGGTMYYPVAVPGALLSVGDPHAAQGDSELNGTAIETSLTGDIQVILHKKENLNSKLQDLNFPLLETEKEWVIHGFSYANHLAELGEDAQKAIYANSSLDKAMKDAAYKTRLFLMKGMGLTEDEAYSLMSVSVDYGVTQVVDGNWGVHAVIDKTLFAKKETKFVSLRTSFERIGAELTWDNRAKTITTTHGSNELVIKIGSTEGSFNGKAFELVTPVNIDNGVAVANEYFVEMYLSKLLTSR
ncbi:acetamidase/formamidase family protein [Paenibacillus abyssi]|uniref:Acetamidase n=1 Tax=Paenibacillus abyssi TaxID=1340531 RepID=A0A917D0T6_9BACL|nr:acetamidase/formamidase family protein [Paenibacillus abyssi]GGG06158.1 acetamidase [Paenibacillus abyssi]